MMMALRSLFLWLAALVFLCRHGTCIVIDVYHNGKHVKQYEDDMAESENRADFLPNSPLRGQMYYAVPFRNACEPVDQANETTYNWIALVDNYLDCPDKAGWYLYEAGYGMMLTYSPLSNVGLFSSPEFPKAIITSYSFLEFLKNNTIMGISPNASEYYVKVTMTTWYFYERLFMIFGAVLLAAVTVSIVIFCGSLCCRTAVHRWRTRGLSRWRVRQLPKRKYKKGKEASESCSICLEDFRIGENLRVLPCDHIFHPSCVDEWLQKWNRTCPLCKSTIQRKKKGRVGGAAQTSSTADSTTSDQERVRLLSERESTTPSTDGDGENPDNYGATGNLDSPILRTLNVAVMPADRERRLEQSVIVTLEGDPDEEQEEEEERRGAEGEETKTVETANLTKEPMTIKGQI